MLDFGDEIAPVAKSTGINMAGMGSGAAVKVEAGARAYTMAAEGSATHCWRSRRSAAQPDLVRAGVRAVSGGSEVGPPNHACGRVGLTSSWLRI